MAEKIMRKIERVLGIPSNAVQAYLKLKKFHSRPRSIDESVYTALNFGGHGYFKVRTMQIPAEIIALARAVEELNPKIILEIGTAFGGTLFIWAQLASEHVISCDIESKRIPGLIYKSFPPPDSRCKVTLMTGNSHTYEFKQRVKRRLSGASVDFLFIDGDHTEQGVEDDYYAYKEFVRPGGIIAFHDIVEKQLLPQNQVYHFWKRLKTLEQTEEFIYDSDQTGYGIGIVRVR